MTEEKNDESAVPAGTDQQSESVTKELDEYPHVYLVGMDPHATVEKTTHRLLQVLSLLGIGLLGLVFGIIGLIDDNSWGWLAAWGGLVLVLGAASALLQFLAGTHRANTLSRAIVWAPWVFLGLQFAEAPFWVSIVVIVMALPFLPDPVRDIVSEYKREPRRANRMLVVFSLWLTSVVGGISLATIGEERLLGLLLILVSTVGYFVFALAGGFRPGVNTAKQPAESSGLQAE